MKKLLAKFFSSPKDTVVFGEEFRKAVIMHSVERRTYPRLRVPHSLPLSMLPTIKFEGQSLPVYDWARGGVGIHGKQFTNIKQGSILNFQVGFPQEKTEFSRQAIFVRNTQTVQGFKFADQNPQWVATLETALAPALRARKAEKVGASSFPTGQNMVELWMSMIGDFVSFQSSGPKQPETVFMCYSDTRCFFNEKDGFRLARKLPTGGYEPAEHPTKDFVDNATLFVYNLTRPTARTSYLVSKIAEVCYPLIFRKHG